SNQPFTGNELITKPNGELSRFSSDSVDRHSEFFPQQRCYTSGAGWVRCSGHAVANDDCLHVKSILRRGETSISYSRSVVMASPKKLCSDDSALPGRIEDV